jgi:hypothetical protein
VCRSRFTSTASTGAIVAPLSCQNYSHRRAPAEFSPHTFAIAAAHCAYLPVVPAAHLICHTGPSPHAPRSSATSVMGMGPAANAKLTPDQATQRDELMMSHHLNLAAVYIKVRLRLRVSWPPTALNKIAPSFSTRVLGPLEGCCSTAASDRSADQRQPQLRFSVCIHAFVARKMLRTTTDNIEVAASSTGPTERSHTEVYGRSVMHVRAQLEKWEKGVAACTSALAIETANVKVYLRRLSCHQQRLRSLTHARGLRAQATSA